MISDMVLTVALLALAAAIGAWLGYKAGSRRERPALSEVYCVRPDDPSEDLAAFEREQDAEAFRATYDNVGDVERVTISDRELAARMVADREADLIEEEEIAAEGAEIEMLADDPSGPTVIVRHRLERWVAAYRLEDGELIEAVSDTTPPSFDWDETAYWAADETTSEPLQRHVRRLLRAEHEKAGGRS